MTKELKQIVETQEKSLPGDAIGQELFASQSDESPLEIESTPQVSNSKIIATADSKDHSGDSSGVLSIANSSSDH